MLFKCFLSYALLVSLLSLKGQDTICKADGKKIIGKVLEIDGQTVKFKKDSNPDGPVYSLSTAEITYIRYQNNEKEEFSVMNTPRESKFKGMSKDEILNVITKKGNLAFIVSKDDNATLHATNGIKGWGYWKITTNKAEADFILKFNYVHAGLGDAFGSAQFINPENDEVLRTTKEVNTIMSWDMNTKRGVINKLIDKEIKPYYK